MRESNDPVVRTLRNQIILKPGMKINRLTLIRKEGSAWICDCDCGTKNYKVTRPYRLKNELIGNVKDHVGSCGCIQRKSFKEANREGTIEKDSIINETLHEWKILCNTFYRDTNRSFLYICQSTVNPECYELLSLRHLTMVKAENAKKSYQDILNEISKFEVINLNEHRNIT